VITSTATRASSHWHRPALSVDRFLRHDAAPLVLDTSVTSIASCGAPPSTVVPLDDEVRIDGMTPDVRAYERADGRHLQAASANIVERAGGEAAAHPPASEGWIDLCMSEDDPIGERAVFGEPGDYIPEEHLISIRARVVTDSRLLICRCGPGAHRDPSPGRGCSSSKVLVGMSSFMASRLCRLRREGAGRGPRFDRRAALLRLDLTSCRIPPWLRPRRS